MLNPNSRPLCRVCSLAKEGHLTNLYDASTFVRGQPNLHTMLRAVCAPVFDKPDSPGMPTNVCAVCRNASIAAYKLHKLCIESDRKLADMLVVQKEPEEAAVEVKEEVVVEQTKLDDPFDRSDEEISEEENVEEKPAEPEKRQKEDYYSKRTCKVCSGDFPTIRDMLDHMKKFHPNVKCEKIPGPRLFAMPNRKCKGKHRCKLCSDAFRTRDGLVAHSKSAHPGVAFVCQSCNYVCETCGSQFGKSDTLTRHVERVHTSERRYSCTVCEMKFKCPGRLKRHGLTHTGEKPYKCPFCQRGFNQTNDLVKHAKNHVQGPFGCDRCGESFRLMRELRDHYGPAHIASGEQVDELLWTSLAALERLAEKMRKEGKKRMQLGIVADTKVLCRVCMVPVVEHPANLYDDASPFGLPSLHDMLRTICAPVFAKPEAEAIVPNMPTIVCLVCRNAIVAAYNLHQQCIETDRRLGELVALMWELHGPDSDEIGEVSEDPPKSSIKEQHASAGEEIPLLNTELVDVIKVEALDLMDENQSNNEEEVNEVRDLQCTNCGISFSSNRAHKERVACLKCGQTLGNSAALLKHIRYTRCSENYERKTQMQKEGIDTEVETNDSLAVEEPSSDGDSGATQTENLQQKPNYPCKVCGKIFDTFPKMMYHRRNHQERVVCPQCGQSFRNRGILHASLPVYDLRKELRQALENAIPQAQS
ncbi:zinc finger protein 124 [Culex quinquefasciatus]|uniref:Zinc finger protein 124 n=1 Tax=Culex quinquefasciatus TaxID=7176 RepID=B0W9R6_CULQU|nr:zinc finger protein 124 [Culex quinquefasciatus]|eukprot:XP_001845450.1 zinc finger protein 124 [Culex quinquefasciatus]